MIFDIDKFVTTPRNDGSQYVDQFSCFCSIGAAAVACGQFNEGDDAHMSILKFNLKCATEHPFLQNLLLGAEYDHLSVRKNHERATRLVVDALLMNEPILAAEGVTLKYTKQVSDAEIARIPVMEEAVA